MVTTNTHRGMTVRISRRNSWRAVGVLVAVAVSVWLLQWPGVTFADKVDRLHPGMTFDEVEQVMGCPPGDYQVPFGEQHYPFRCVCIGPGSRRFPVFRSWNGEDGEVCVWGMSDSPQVTSVDWHRFRDRPRSNAEILWEQVSGWWDDVMKATGAM